MTKEQRRANVELPGSIDRKVSTAGSTQNRSNPTSEIKLDTGVQFLPKRATLRHFQLGKPLDFVDLCRDQIPLGTQQNLGNQIEILSPFVHTFALSQTAGVSELGRWTLCPVWEGSAHHAWLCCDPWQPARDVRKDPQLVRPKASTPPT
jgi:hypothetical protein